MGGGLESRSLGRVYGADGAVNHPHDSCLVSKLPHVSHV